ncbi:MAG TPA: hypothetical protein VMU41_03640 [Candidatus Binataceae bacterium]|nr:hypothetical protein [Candidatus Binataceae bacterium]
MLTKDKQVGTDAKIEFADRHFGQPPAEPEFLDSENPTDQTAADDRDQLTQLAEPWHLIIPPVKGGKPDMEARESEWILMQGFDSKEQCEYAIQVEYGYGKCIRAKAH